MAKFAQFQIKVRDGKLIAWHGDRVVGWIKSVSSDEQNIVVHIPIALFDEKEVPGFDRGVTVSVSGDELHYFEPKANSDLDKPITRKNLATAMEEIKRHGI